MPRQNKDGAWSSDKAERPSFLEMFGPAETQGIGSWHWGAISPVGLLTDVVDAANKHGDAVSFATNKAHTAGSITVLHNGDRPRRWVNSYDEAETFLEALLAEYQATPI